MSELENIDNVDGEVSGEVIEDNSAEIEAEQERLKREHEEYLNSFPDTTVFYRDLLVNGNVKSLGTVVRDPHIAEQWGFLDKHYDESELTYIGTKECGTWYLKGYERLQPTRQEMIDRKKAEMDAVVQELLDRTAKTKGFTNGAYCAGYAGDPDPEFNAHGTAFKIWRSKVWRKCYQILDQVESGEIPIEDITAEYVLGQLPEIEW